MLTKEKRREAIKNRHLAMSHSTRADILRLLVERGPASPAQLGRELDEKTENVSFHCKRLVELDCAEPAGTRQRRGATEHFYRATERSLVATDEWAELHPTDSHRIKADIMQQILDDFVKAELSDLVSLDSEFHMSRTPIQLDAEGLTEALEIFERARLEIADLESRCAERTAASGVSTFPTSSSLALFRTPPATARGSSNT